MKAGFYEADITPVLGMSCTSFDNAKSKQILTPLSVNASIWSDNKRKVAIVGIDACVLERHIWEKEFLKLRNEIGLNLLLCSASHTHKSGPVIEDWVISEDYFKSIDGLNPQIKARGNNIEFIMPGDEIGCKETNLEYLEKLETQIINAVIEADRRIEPVRLIIESAKLQDVGYNRRIRMKSGLTFTHPGKGNPNAVSFAGPVNEEVVVLGAVNADDKLIGNIVNYGCHATCEASSSFSGDWPFFMRETLKKHFDSKPTTVFINGCCGDITQINNLSNDPPRQSGKWPKILGQRVGFAAIDALTRGEPEKFSQIAFHTMDIDLKYRKITPEKYLQALQLINSNPNKNAEWWCAMGIVMLKKKMELEPHVKCNINVVQIGNLAIVTNPAESFAQTGINIKRNSSFPFTMVSSLTNGWIGYMPVAEAFGPHGGGYEPKMRAGSYLEITAAEKVEQKSIELLKQLHPEKEKSNPEIINGREWKLGKWKPREL